MDGVSTNHGEWRFDATHVLAGPPQGCDLVTLEANVMSQQGEPLQQGTVVTQITGPDGKRRT